MRIMRIVTRTFDIILLFLCEYGGITMAGVNYRLENEQNYNPVQTKLTILLDEPYSRNLDDIFPDDRKILESFAKKLYSIQPADLLRYCYTLPEMTQMTGLHRSTIARLYKNQILLGLRLGSQTNGRIFVLKEAFDWWIKQHFNFEVKEEKEAVAI